MSIETEQANIAERKERLERELTEISIALKGEFAKLTGKDRGYIGANSEEWQFNPEPIEINQKEFQPLEKMEVTLPGGIESKTVEAKAFDGPEALDVTLPGKIESKTVEAKTFDGPEALDVQLPNKLRVKELKKISFERPMLHVEYPVLPEIPEIKHDSKPPVMQFPDMTPTRTVVDSLLAAIKSWSKE